MLTKGHYFPDQTRDEQIVLFIRRHILSFLPWIIFITLMVIMPIIMYFNIREAIMEILTGPGRIYVIIGFSSYLLIALAVFLTAWITFYLNVVIITPEHLVDIRQSGLFNRRVSEQSLLRVQDVSAQMSGLFQTFFNYGTVNVETAGEAPNFAMPSIPNPSKVSNTILKLHEELVQKSGYEEEDMAEGIGLESQKDNSLSAISQDSQIQEKIPKKNPESYHYEKKESATEMINKLGHDIDQDAMTGPDSWFDGVKIEKENLPLKESECEKEDEAIVNNIEKSDNDNAIYLPAGKDKPVGNVALHESNSQSNKDKIGVLDLEDGVVIMDNKEGELSDGEMVNF